MMHLPVHRKWKMAVRPQKVRPPESVILTLRVRA